MQISDLDGARWNPRKISKKSAEGLAESLHVFGDLSGIVFNKETKQLVCAHQRKDALSGFDPSEISWGKSYTVNLGWRASRFESKERDGFFSTSEGVKYRIREVSWPIEFERAANVAANNPHIQGEWTDDIKTVMAEIESEKPEGAEDAGFDALIDELTPTDPDKTPEDEFTEKWLVIIDCESEKQQITLLERFEKEDLDAKALIS